MGLDGGHSGYVCMAQSRVGIVSVYGASVLRSCARVLLQDFHSDNNHPTLDMPSCRPDGILCIIPTNHM